MSHRTDRYLIYVWFLIAGNAIAADHLVGSVDMRFYFDSLQVASNASWDWDPDPFQNPPHELLWVTGRHVVTNVQIVTIQSLGSQGGSFIRGPANFSSCYTAGLELATQVCCAPDPTGQVGDLPYGGPSGDWYFYLCTPDPPPPSGGGVIDQICPSPVVISLENKVDDDIDAFPLSGPRDPVTFDIAANGSSPRITWTKKGSKIGFLTLDRDGDGAITSGAELFGNYTPMASTQPAPLSSNGFFALAGYDMPAFGGNGDGHIGPEDAIWRRLRIWIDKNHDGVSQADELFSLESLEIQEIGLEYRLTNLADRFGNLFRYRSTAIVGIGKERRVVPTYDVFFQAVN